MRYLYPVLLVFMASCSNDDTSTPNENEDMTKDIRLKSLSYNTSEVTFNYDANGKIEKTLTSTPSNSFETHFFYNDQGKIIQIEDDEAFNYNDDGLLGKITSPNYDVEIEYDNDGKVTSLSYDHVSQFTYEYLFEYDAENMLSEITQLYINTQPTGVPPFEKYRLTYNDKGNLIKVKVDKSNDNNSYTEEHVLTYLYDDKKNPVTTLHNNMVGKDPFSFIKPLPSIFLIYLFHSPYYYYYPENNLIYTSHLNVMNGDEYTETYTHLYNEEGFPTSTEIATYNSSSQNSNTINLEWSYERN